MRAKSKTVKNKGNPKFDDGAGPSTSRDTINMDRYVLTTQNRDREEMEGLGFTARQMQWIQAQMQRLTMLRDGNRNTGEQEQTQG